MSSRDYYQVTYRHESSDRARSLDRPDYLDNETEVNANQFKLFDDFTTDLRIHFNPLRRTLFHGVTSADEERVDRRRADPNDSGVDMENGNDTALSNGNELLENEVMVDTWSSMDSSNSPLTDSGPSASDDCIPSTSSDVPRASVDAFSPVSPHARRLPDTKGANKSKTVNAKPLAPADKARARDLTLDLETPEPALPRRPHFLDEDYQPPSRSNIECRIPKPHFLDHSPSPDEFDERSDITNPNFLDDDILEADDQQAQRKSGALPKRPQKTPTPQDERPRTNYRSTLHYGLESAARSSERDKRASQLYRGTWPGERDVWNGQETASVRSFSSNGSADNPRSSSNLENKMDTVYSLLSLLTLSPDSNADLSGPLLEMSRSVESCIAMRQAGCIPLLVQLIHSKLARETRDRAAKALRNIIHTQTDDKAGRREARVWRLLEQVREYCYVLEDLIEARKDGKEVIDDDAAKHPSQSVAALMKLSFDEEHRHVVCQLGGLQTLAALVSGDQLAHGSRTDDNTCLTMRKYAGMTLTNLTFGDGNNKSLLCSFKDFMMALVEQLESPNDDMRQVTAAVLRNLSWRADTNSKQVLREVDAVKGLTKAAMTCQKEATLKSVLSALWNLTAHCSMNKVALCSVDGALGFLVDMLSYNSPTKTLAIVENAGGIMRNVSSHIAVREDYRHILRERNCLSVLLQHLKSPSLTVVSNSCGTLWNLSARCPEDQQFLWDHAAVPMLRSLIHSKHKMIAMGSGAALKNLLNSKPGKTHIVTMDPTARNMNLPALPTLGARKQKALDQELDQNLAETCDNIEPATSPTTSNREEKNLFTATERQLALNLERHRMTSSSPLMGALTSQISLSHSAHLASYLSCSNTLLKGALVSRNSAGGSSNNVNRSDSKDSVTSTHSDSIFERTTRTGKVPVPTPRNKDLMKTEPGSDFKMPITNDGAFAHARYPLQPPIPPPRSSTELRTNYPEPGYDVDQDSCDQPVDYSMKYSETKSTETLAETSKPKSESSKKTKKDSGSYGDYQETDLDQPTDYSLRYAELQSETGSDSSEPAGPAADEDTIKHFATEGTPYETPIIFSTATSMSDLRVIGKSKVAANVKENPEIMTHSDEKDTCSIEDPRPDNDRALARPLRPVPEKRGVFDTKFSSGLASPEKPVRYCDEGTPGCFSRVSSLSSLGEPAEELSLAKRNARATINPETDLQDQASGTKDKEGSKAVTFASEPVASSTAATPALTSSHQSVQQTPLMFSRSSSLGSLGTCEPPSQPASVMSEVSRLTSGCISPSEIPDSPGQSAPLSPRAPPRDASAPATPPPVGLRSVFEERATTFLVENTPAHFSTATSLSSLTIDDHEDAKLDQVLEDPSQDDDAEPSYDSNNTNRARAHDAAVEFAPLRGHIKDARSAGGDSCTVYLTEDTPAVLSHTGSQSNLSVLSINSEAPHLQVGAADTSDSSNLSDAADLLEECIQKGIAKVVKNNGPPSDAGSVGQYMARDGPYRSLPPYLRSSTETVKMSHEFSRNVRDSRTPSSERPLSAEGSPPPPLPPKVSCAPAPPRPPPMEPARDDGRKHESRLPIKTQRNLREKPKLAVTSNLARNDSLSSLSLDSFGSTDREIFEETVKAGLSSVQPRKQPPKTKAHSVERPSEIYRPARPIHKSLDRSDKIAQHRPKPFEFEKNLASNRHTKKRSETEFASHSMTRTPYSYHGDTASSSLAYYTRSKPHNSRYYDDGPPSLPARIDAPRHLERSSSLSSLSNDSFGSTDKEVFERSVRLGMSRGQPKKRDDGKLRVRSDDRLEIREPHRARRRRNEGHNLGALDKMVGEEYTKDRAILEEVIARGAGETKPNMPPNVPPKNVPAPSAARARADGSAARAPPATRTTGCDETLHDSAFDTSLELNSAQKDSEISNAYRSMDSGNITYTSTDVMGSNECLAPKSANTTLESDAKDELNRSNESYAEVLDESWSEPELPPNNCDAATLTRDKSKQKLEWTDIKNPERPADFDDSSKRSTDTWNDNTCPDDVTFPTISGSVHLVSSIRSEVVDAGHALPDLLEKAGLVSMSFSRPDLTNKLDGPEASTPNIQSDNEDKFFLDGVPEPSFASIVDDGEHKFDSFLASEIEQEAARLAAQLKTAQFGMENSVTSLNSLDLDNIRPPSNLGSLLSLSASGQFEDTNQTSKKCNSKSRKKSLPVALMVKRALSNSMHQGSSEHLDSNPTSILDNIKPPSEMDIIDLESSMVSVASIASEVVDVRRTPVVFDFKQPIQDFPLCNNFVFHDLDKINPPSLFDEMAESTMEIEQTTAQQILDDCVSNTLNVVTDIPSGSEDCTPLPSDISSVESTPKKHQNNRYLTPKEKRLASKDRYQTYTITDTVTECDVVLKVDTEEFLTWTKSESDSRSDEYVTANSEGKSKRRLSAKQRRMEDRARYQTQTVDLNTILTQASNSKVDSHIESLKQRLAAKKTMKQKRMEDAERFRTRTLSEDIPPSPTFVTKDANFENIETTTGYDSLSSNELNHQQIIDERLADDVFSRDGDSGHNDDEFELNSTQMQTYTKSFRSFLPAVASPAAMDLCIINNLKNIEMTASYQRALQNEVKNNPSSSDFASYEGDSNSEDKVHSDSEPEACSSRPKPKIIKPVRRDESLDSNESQETEQEAPKGVRGRKKAAYVSPYRRNIPSAKKTTTVSPAPKTTVKMLSVKVPATPVKPQTSVRTPNRTPCTSKATSASTSPKKTPLGKSLTVAQKPHPNTVPLSAVKPLPLERQGTFTKEDSVVPARDLPMPDKVTSQLAKAATPTKPTTTSPSRLPQMNRYNRPQIRKTNSVEKPTPKRANTRSAPTMRNSASNHSLQSNDSGKTVTLASRSSRQGSTSSVNSIPSAKANTKDIESKIAGLWKKVEQTKKQTGKPDRRVWIEPKVEPPKLIRSSTFEGQPKQNVSTAPKQKTSIGIRTTQIPSLRPKAPSKAQAPATQIPSVSKKPTNARALARRPVNS